MSTVAPSSSPASGDVQTEFVPSIWTGQFLLALTIGLTFGIGFNAFIPIFPLYLKGLGTSAGEVGIIVGAYGLAALVLRPLTGRLTDQFGPQVVTVAGALLFTLGTLVIGFTASTPLLILLRLVQSAGLVCFFTASTALSVSTVHPRRMGQALGIAGLTGSIGGLAVSPFAVQIASFLGWGGTFLLLAGMGCLATVLCFGVHLPKRPKPEASARKLPLVNVPAIAPASIFLGFTLTQGPILAFVPLLAADRDLGNPGIFLAAVGLGNMMVRPFCGWAADHYGRSVVILPGLVLAGVAMLLISLVHSQLWFGLTGVVYGVANGMTFTGLLALTLDRVPPEQRGSAIATFQWAWDIGSSVSAAALGQIVILVGYAGIFAIAAAFPFIGATAFVIAVVRFGMGGSRPAAAA